MASLELALNITGHDQLSGPLGGMHKAVSGFGDEVKRVGEMAAGFALGGALQALGGSLSGAFEKGMHTATEFGGEVRKLQREIGGSAESVSSMLVAMERFGVSGDQASVSLGIFSKHLLGVEDAETQAVKGSKSFGQTMKDLNVDFTDTSGHVLPMNDLLLQVADRFKEMPNGVDKTALAMQLFGRSGKDMIGFLNQGSEGLKEAMEAAQKYGLVLTGENLQAVRNFGLAHKDLDEAMQGVTLQLGLAFMPMLAKAAEGLSVLAQAFNQNVVPAITKFADEMAGPVQNAFELLGSGFAFVSALITAFTDDAGAMGVVYDIIRKVFGDSVAEFVQPFLQSFMEAIPAIQDFVSQVGGFLGHLGDVFQMAIHGDVEGAVHDLVSLIGDALPGIVSKLGEWGMAFVEWVAPFIPPLLSTLGDLLADLGAWLLNPALPDIVGKLQEWGAAFVAWVEPQVAPLLAQLGGLGSQIVGWLSAQVPTWTASLSAWGREFVAWVAPLIPPLLGEMASLQGSIVHFIVVDALPQIVGSLIGWSTKFYSWVTTDVLPKLPGELAKIIQTIVSWVTGGGATQAASSGAQIGQAMVDGLRNAISGAAQSIASAAASMVSNTIAAARAAADAHSPSREMELLGQDLGEGLELGILGSVPKVKQAAHTYGDTILNEMDSFASALDIQARTVQDKLADIAQRAGDAVANAVDSANTRIASIISGAQDQLNRLGGSLADALSSVFQESGLARQIADEKAAYAQSRQDQEAAYRHSQDLVKADADYKKAVANEMFEFNRKMAEATTIKQKEQVEQQHVDAGVHLKRAYDENLASLNDRYKQQENDTQRRREADAAQALFVKGEDAKMTAFKQGVVTQQRDDAIAAVKLAEETNLRKIQTTADDSRLVLLRSFQNRVADLTAQLLDKIPPLTAAAQSQLDGFLTHVNDATDSVIADIAGSLGSIPTALNNAITTVGALSTALDAIPDETVNIDIVTRNISTGGTSAGGPSSNTSALAQALANPGASGPGGIYDAARKAISSGGAGVAPADIGSSAGGASRGYVPPSFDVGGLVPGALGAPLLAWVHGGETVMPPGRSSGLDYDRLAASIAAALAGLLQSLPAPILHVDGQMLGRAVRTADRRFSEANIPSGVGGL